jgi:hypothetical protein
MQDISTMQASGSDNFKGQQLTIGLDLGDRSSNYCVLNGTGDILLEDKLPMTSQAMKQLFGRMLRSRIAMETGTHSPWVSRLLTELGHEVIVAHAQKVRLIVKSRRKDDRRDRRTLARLARIDPQLLSPVPTLIGTMSFQLVIPWRVALPQSPPPLRQLGRSCNKSSGQYNRKAANGR